MENILHFLSETAVWETNFEFKSVEGKITHGKGETSIEVKDPLILFKWIIIGKNNSIKSDSEIYRLPGSRYEYAALTTFVGLQEGFFDVHKNVIYTTFRVRENNMNGYEINVREGNTCRVHGAIYEGMELVSTWIASMCKKEG